MKNKIEFRNCTEVRAVDSNDGEMVIEGVVNNLGEWSKVLYGSFKERVNPGAFTRALDDAKKSNRDIFFHALHNTRELPIASINSETMELKEEDNKLKIRATLPNTSLAKDIYELVKSRVLREFSFGFSNAKCEWGLDSDNVRTRTITDLTLHEISIVTTGAYNATNAEARGFNPLTEIEEAESRANKESEEQYQYNKNLCKIKGWC